MMTKACRPIWQALVIRSGVTGFRVRINAAKCISSATSVSSKSSGYEETK